MIKDESVIREIRAIEVCFKNDLELGVIEIKGPFDCS